MRHDLDVALEPENLNGTPVRAPRSGFPLCMRPFLSGVLFLAAGVGAPQASYTYTPQPPPYVDPSPSWLTALNTPRLGTTFQLKVPATYGSVYAPNHVLVVLGQDICPV